MEYGEAINREAAEGPCNRLHQDRRRRTDLRRSREAVAEGYCVCVVAGEDAAEEESRQCTGP